MDKIVNRQVLSLRCAVVLIFTTYSIKEYDEKCLIIDINRMVVLKKTSAII
jgi:hypothetical protein